MPSHFVCTATCDLPVSNELNKIIIHGARENNLKNICFEIPKGKLTVLTGPSGSGKSSIATDVLQMECLRQFLESLGMTTDHIGKPKVEKIIGLSPSIGISKHVTDFNPRSTVGTKTGILTILRNLFASIGCSSCEGCGKRIKQPLTNEAIVSISKKKYFNCPYCGHQLEKLKMAHFSSNATDGACALCQGTGEIIGIDIQSLLREDKTISNGGVTLWDKDVAEHYEHVIQAASEYYSFPFDTTVPIKYLTAQQRNFLLYGISCPDFVEFYKDFSPPKKVSEGKFEGIVPNLWSRYKRNPHKAPQSIKKFISCTPCHMCHGTDLGRLGRKTTVKEKSISDVSSLGLSDLLFWVCSLEQFVAVKEWKVVESLSCALKERISNLIDVGLDYLTLNRPLPSLSAGESQRVRLACVLGSELTGVLYVLDEPTTGLHPKDTSKLLKTLKKINESGNTVLLIEHDLDVIKEADHLIDLGPGGGNKGGEIVACGSPAEVMVKDTSLTGKYLAKRGAVELSRHRLADERVLTICGASENNLKNIDVHIPLNQFVVITGASGSGKSTFLLGILDKVARKHFHGSRVIPGKHRSVHGLEQLDRVITVDQATIGRSSRSNVATYTKLFDLIRNLFASLPIAKAWGFGANEFSFNASEERCENCKGAAVVAIDMAFMPDVEIKCPTCNGMRFNEELLSVKFQGKSIADILNMTVCQAIEIFSDHSSIFSILDLMCQVGLDYLLLGQSTSTLSSGEAQRIKLAKELSKSSRESTLYLLDEPTVGLHPAEVDRLIDILLKLVSKGNTVVVIEHNLDAICRADTVIDFGPRGGTSGGEIVAVGTPQQVAANHHSLTGQCLQAYFDSPNSLQSLDLK